jgi:small subunit ribosomal protein S4
MTRITFALESSARGEVPGWLEVDPDNMAGKVLDVPTRDQIDLAVQEQLIVELYSK